jgi:DegV family protein with EDD domain
VGIRIVTDSASDLPPELAATLGIEIVPLTIRFGTEELVDGRDLTVEAFWQRVRASAALPETSAPSAGAFIERFRALREVGATGIVCICLSSKLSATLQAARIAADEVRTEWLPHEFRIEGIDSLSASMGAGALCLAAARRAATGDALDAVIADVVERRDRTRLFAVLDTLEHLKKGGRVRNTTAFLGSALSIKPVIEIRDGLVEPGGKVRTRSRALAFLVAQVAAQPVQSLAVLHGQADDVGTLLDLLEPIVPRPDIVVGDVGPVIGTHAGPGVIGVTFQIR